MVATHTQRGLKEPLNITIAGTQRTFLSHDSVLKALRDLEHSEKSLNRQAAQAAFDLGRALIDTAKLLGYGSLNHLYNEAGINGRRAERAIRFAKHYSTDEGLFDLDAYKAGELCARNRNKTGESLCNVDAEGNPSLTAVQRAVGLLPDSTKKSTSDTSVGSVNQTKSIDPMGMLTELGDQHRAERINEVDSLSNESTHWNCGDQLVIDFDLVATERKLAKLIERADQEYRSGKMSGHEAAAIDSEIDSFTRGLAQRINSNKINSDTQTQE